MVAAAILDFGNVNNCELDLERFAQNLVGRCITAMRR